MQRLVVLAIVAAVGGAVLGFIFAGSPNRLADGTRIAGIDVGAGARQRQRVRAAEAARATCDERNPPGEIDLERH